MVGRELRRVRDIIHILRYLKIGDQLLFAGFGVEEVEAIGYIWREGNYTVCTFKGGYRRRT